MPLFFSLVFLLVAAPALPLSAASGQQLAASVEEMPPQMREAYIRGIQEALTERGFRPGPIDGVMGPQTRAAIRAYQRAAGLPETGVASDDLLDHIRFIQPSVRAGAAASAPAIDPQLVRDVQFELYQRHYDPGPIDGVVGPRTRDAVRAYQRDRGLSVTGEVNRQLLDELRRSPLPGGMAS